MPTTIILECTIDTWNPRPGAEAWEEVLEDGNVIHLPNLAFHSTKEQSRFLDPKWSDGKAKNISLRGSDTPLRGAVGSPDELAELKTLIARFASSAETLVHGLFPRYRAHLRRGFTSYRPWPVEGRKASWRKDDSRLHVDSFPSNPTGGKRLLRVFTNVNPSGQPRVWRVGEPFEAFAEKFLPRTRRPLPGSAWMLAKLGITKSLRSEYDHLMGQLHDLGKADADYQASSPQASFAFPAGTTWIVYSDQVQHAVMSGQHMLEQTFYLDVADQVRPDSSPLKILERLAGRPLATS